jgi:hypothetical protein
MIQETFDTISEMLGKTGTTVSMTPDGKIVVTLPDSEKKLAECVPGADGGLEYAVYRGDGGTTKDSGGVDKFVEAVSDGMDSWLEFVPYDADAVEPGISSEYRMAIGESREDRIRNSLFEMGLDNDQVNAMLEVANILFESSVSSTIIVNGKALSGSSFGEIVKNNKPFLTRQWLLEQLKKKTGPKPEYAKMGNRDLSALLGKMPSAEELQDFVQQFKKTETKETVATDDDVLGRAWNQFDGNSGSPKNARAAVMSNETPIVSGEKDDFDEELGHSEVNRGEEFNEVNNETMGKGDIGEQMGDMVHTYDSAGNENAAYDAEHAQEESPVDEPEPETAAPAESFDFASAWGGDIEDFTSTDFDTSDYDDFGSVVALLDKDVSEMVDTLANSFAKKVAADTNRVRQNLMMQMFGRGPALGGLVARLIKSDTMLAHKIAEGKGIINPGPTPATRKVLGDMLATDLFTKTIATVQQKFGDYVASMKGIIPFAFDAARGVSRFGPESDNPGAELGKVDPAFIRIFRAYLMGKGYPFAGFSGGVIEKITTDLGSVMKLGDPEVAQASPRPAQVAQPTA